MKTTIEVLSVLDIIVAWYANISLMWFYEKNKKLPLGIRVDNQNGKENKGKHKQKTIQVQKSIMLK